MNNRLINTKVAGGGGGCTDIVDNYDPFGGGGLALYQLNGDATDVSTNYNGTWNGTEIYGTGVFGQAAVFNTSSAIVSPNLSGTSLTNSSISIWAKGYQVLFGLKTDGSNNRQYALQVLNDSTIQLTVVNKNGSTLERQVNSGSTINTNQWNHFVLTPNTLYVNGVELNQFYSATPTPISISSLGGDVFMIGAKSDAQSTFQSYFTGSIDQVRVFNTTLTPLEVEALYTEQLCVCDGTVDTLDILGDGSCIATYQLDGNANDLSGNYSGTPTDVSYGVGEFDLAGVLSGSSNYITLPSGSPFDDSDTIKAISFWAKMDGVLATFNHAFRVIGNSSHFFEIIIRSDNECRISIRQGSSSNQINVETINCPKGTGVWRHYVFQLDGTQKIYIDGAEQATQVTYQTGTATTSSWISYPNYTNPVFTLGRNDGTTDFDLDQVRIFNKALNQNEVTTLFEESACTVEPIPPSSNQLVLAFNNGYVYGAGGLVKPDAGNSYGLNVIYHPVSGKHYAAQLAEDTDHMTSIYESSDGGATWSTINLPAFSSAGFGDTAIYNPQTEKIYFGRTRQSVMYVYSINSDGTIGYNRVNNPHTNSGFAVQGTDYSYLWIVSSTGQSNGGGYFVPIANFTGDGSNVSIDTSMRLIGGTNRPYGQGLNWETGDLKTFSDNNDISYFSTSGSFEANTYSEIFFSGFTMTYENDAWFFVNKNDRTQLYRGTTVNGASSLVFNHTQFLSAVRYNPTLRKYYCFDALGDVYSSSNGLSWSFDFSTGGTVYSQTLCTISNFL